MMNKIVSKAAVGLLVAGAALSAYAGGPDVPPAPMVTPGFYLSLGGSWNTLDAHYCYDVTAHPLEDVSNFEYTRTAKDSHWLHQNRFAPMVDIGYWAPVDNEWLWGLQINYKYLDWDSDNPMSGTLPNISIFTNPNATPNAHEVFASTRMRHELLLLFYFGIQYSKGYAYLGAGPAVFWVTNRLKVAGIINPNNTNAGTVSVIQSAVFSVRHALWGGAAQIGYNYYFKPTWFLSFNYTYAISQTKTFLNTVTSQATFLGPQSSQQPEDARRFTVHSSGCVRAQEFMFSINKVFAM